MSRGMGGMVRRPCHSGGSARASPSQSARRLALEGFPGVEEQAGGSVDVFFGGVPAEAETDGAAGDFRRDAERGERGGDGVGFAVTGGAGRGAELGRASEQLMAEHTGEADRQGVR